MTKTKQPTYHTAAGAQYWIYNPKAKKTIVAIHGLRGTHHGLQFIAKSLPSFRFIIPDLPGFGVSAPFKTEPHDTKNYALWLDKFIDELTLNKPPVLLGHSFGSLVVSEFATSHPTKISKLILINSIAKHGNPLGGLITKAFYNLGILLPKKIGTSLLKNRLAIVVITEVMMTNRQKQMKSMIYQQHFAHFGSFANRQSVYETFNATMSGSILKYATRLKVPVLLIVGAKDSLAPLEGQKHLQASLVNSELKVIPNVGHLVHYETPERAADYINAFLSNSSK